MKGLILRKTMQNFPVLMKQHHLKMILGGSMKLIQWRTFQYSLIACSLYHVYHVFSLFTRYALVLSVSGLSLILTLLIWPNKKISVFRETDLKILGRVGTHIFLIIFLLEKKIQFYAF